MTDWLDLLFYGDRMVTPRGGPEQTLFSLMLAFLLGQVVGWIYMWSHRVLSYSQTFAASLVVLPVLVALLMMLMAGSMVVAFGLLAVFAVVRFRNVLKDTRDTTYVLWAIVEGMAVGTGNRSTAVVSTIFVALVLMYLRATLFGSRQRYDVVLSLLCAGQEQVATQVVRPILHRHSSKIHLASARKQDEAVDLSYRLLLRDPNRSSELQAELEKIEGVERVSVFVREDESEV